MEMLSAIKRVGRKGINLRDLIRRERKATLKPDVSLTQLCRWWSRGFLGESVVYYGLDEDNWRDYVSDYARAIRTPYIDGSYNPTLNDKLVFYHTMVSLSAPTPAVYGLIGRHGVSWFNPPAASGLQGSVLELLHQQRELVLKPVDGGLGDRIVFLTLDAGTMLVNGQPRQEQDLAALLLPGTLLCERLHQATYAAEIFEGSTNTLRLITMWDYEKGEPFVAAVEHRFGTHRSAPVDNTSKGGVFANVDVATGELGQLILSEPSLGWTPVHPDTGAQVEGVRVPRWETFLDRLLELAQRLAHIPYIGWDVVIGDEGYYFIEGNAAPDTQTQAVAGPLLADPRVRRFYEHHGVISRPRRTLLRASTDRH
jgi:hypothetical protein